MPENESTECRLRRVNTPHYGRQARLAIAPAIQQQQSPIAAAAAAGQHRLNTTGDEVPSGVVFIPPIINSCKTAVADNLKNYGSVAHQFGIRTIV